PRAIRPHGSPAATRVQRPLTNSSTSHAGRSEGNPALIDELIDFLTTGKSGALLINELRRHGSRRHHPGVWRGSQTLRREALRLANVTRKPGAHLGNRESRRCGAEKINLRNG